MPFLFPGCMNFGRTTGCNSSQVRFVTKEGTNNEAPAVDSKWTTIQTRSVKSEVARDPEWMDLTPLGISQSGKYSSFLFLYKPKSEVSDREIGDIDVLPSDRLIACISGKSVGLLRSPGRKLRLTCPHCSGNPLTKA